MSGGCAIDNVEFARSGRTVNGVLGLAELPRAAEMLGSARIEYRLRGYVGPRGKPMLRLKLTGVIGVQCQRCLGALDLEIDQEAVFELRPAESDISDEDLQNDDLDFLVYDREMSVVELVEDEIILGVPVAPKHGDCAVAEKPSGEEGSAKRPFDALASLKK